MNDFYVYIYFDKSVSGEFVYGRLKFQHLPIYVGKGRNSRCTRHIWDCFNPKNKNIYGRLLSKKIRKMINNGNYPEILIFKKDMYEKDAFKLEIDLISKIGRRIVGNGPLCNNSEGGEGVSGSSSPRYVVCVYDDSGKLISIERGPKDCMIKYDVTSRSMYKQLSGKQISSKNGFRFRKISEGLINIKPIDEIILNKRHKSICQYDNSENLLNEYFSVTDASKYLNVSRTAINNNLKGWSKTCSNFVFKYK